MDELNLVKNPRFAVGRDAPRWWVWYADGELTRWRHEPAANGQAQRVMRIECRRANRAAVWSQTLRCKGGQHYRVEADVECDCDGAHGDAGLVFSLQAYADEEPTGPMLHFAPVRRASTPLTLRGYFKAPADAHRLGIRIGMVHALGWARVHDVRLIANLEHDACSHVLAIPPPAYAERPPRQVHRAAVCGHADVCPSLLEILRLQLGDANVSCIPAGSGDVNRVRADAILIPGDVPPAGLRTVRQLEDLARNRIVVISMGAFVRLTHAPAAIKTITQPDDPLHAKVACGCFLTAGFAMQDMFPFASPGDQPNTFTQRQFVTNRAFHEFRNRYGFAVFLTAVTDRDATMDKPIGLFKPTAGGAAVVCDLTPLEGPFTTLGEPGAAAALLLSMVAGPRHGLGQYTCPARSGSAFRQELIELQTRFPAFECINVDRSEQSAAGAVVRLGHDAPSFGLMPPQRPAIVIRTGLCGGDEAGIYGTLLWLKRLVRPAPHSCPYARYLTRRFRIVWLPLDRPWNGAIGLSPSEAPRRHAYGNFDPGPVRAVIDVTVGRHSHPRAVFGRPGALRDRCAAALPALAGALDAHRFIAGGPEPDGSSHAFAVPRWRRLDLAPEVVLAETAFGDPLHRSTVQAGGDGVRIELPASRTDLMADSLWRTDLAAGMLEHVVGLACDGFVMNHQAEPIELDRTAVLGESCEEAFLVRSDPRSGEDRAERCPMRPGQTIRLEPGTALCK